MSIRQGNNIISGVTSTNYNDLSNKPQINSIELSGNKSLDDLSIQNKLIAGENITIAGNTISATGNGRNIGDIFWTTRTDSALNGAVEANGAQYNFADVNGGDNNVQALLESGALPSVSIAKFDEMAAEQGGCDSFGYGTGKTLYALKMEYSLLHYYTDINVDHPVSVVESAKVYDLQGNLLEGWYLKYDNTLSGILVYDNEGEQQGSWYDVFPDETIESNEADTPTTYFKVPKKLGRVLVRTQKPTADNNYTWYNVYADGWVEQGGKGSTSASTAITFAIPMATSYYALSFGGNGASTNRNCYLCAGYNRTSTGFVMQAVVVNAKSQTSGTGTDSSTWICAGYAAPAEYTKDKWDYQNVQVERPMVQLFNSATDEAVATCTSVLSDVSALNAHRVIEFQAPTSENGYTWYRKYADGWVEQGGLIPAPATSNTGIAITLPIEMRDANYHKLKTLKRAIDNNQNLAWGWFADCANEAPADTATTAYFSVAEHSYTQGAFWQVSGMSAQ